MIVTSAFLPNDVNLEHPDYQEILRFVGKSTQELIDQCLEQESLMVFFLSDLGAISVAKTLAGMPAKLRTKRYAEVLYSLRNRLANIESDEADAVLTALGLPPVKAEETLADNDVDKPSLKDHVLRTIDDLDIARFGSINEFPKELRELVGAARKIGDLPVDSAELTYLGTQKDSALGSAWGEIFVCLSVRYMLYLDPEELDWRSTVLLICDIARGFDGNTKQEVVKSIYYGLLSVYPAIWQGFNSTDDIDAAVAHVAQLL